MTNGKRVTRRSELRVRESSALETMAVVVVVVSTLYLGRAIAIPIAIAILVSFSLGPLVTALRRRRVGRVPSVAIVVLPVLLALGAFGYLVTTEIGRLAENLPAYQSNIEQKLTSLEQSLPARDMLARGRAYLKSHHPVAGTTSAIQPHVSSRATPPAAAPVPVEIEDSNAGLFDLATSLINPFVDPLVGIALVLLFVAFFLLEREDLRDRIIRLAGADDLHRTTMAMDEAGYRVSRYLALQSLVNSVFGIVIGLGLFLVGVPNAALWGGLAAALRFIPYLGVITAAVLPLALAFAVDPGWTMLFWTGGLFLGLELLTGNVVEPWLYGSSTGLSAVALVISAIFWTWLWGPIGLLLATPLTVCVMVVGRHVPQFTFLEILLGNEAPLKPEESLYQRLLAGKPDEATLLAEDFLRDRPSTAFYDGLALPALLLAEHDRARSVLGDDHRRQIVEGFRLVADNLAPDPGPTPDSTLGRDEAPTAELVLCVAGRSDLDEAASLLLAQRLEQAGIRTLCLSHEASIRVAIPELEASRIHSVYLSYLDPQSVAHARYLIRRFRRRLGPHIRLVAGFWGAQAETGELDAVRVEIRADKVVTTFEAAVEMIAPDRLAERTASDSTALTLDELAIEAAAAVAGTA